MIGPSDGIRCMLVRGGTSKGACFVADLPADLVVLEHPTGTFETASTTHGDGVDLVVERAGIVRTARKLMDGRALPREYR